MAGTLIVGCVVSEFAAMRTYERAPGPEADPLLVFTVSASAFVSFAATARTTTSCRRVGC